MKTLRGLILTAAVVLGSAAPASASTINWADWVSSTLTTVTGTIGGVGVTFTSSANLAFVQTGTGINYWGQTGASPYMNAVVGNDPTASELIALNPLATNTLTFATAVTDPVLAILSMGQPGIQVDYTFGQSFNILSSGTGYWGATVLFNQVGNTLQGKEAHGTIQFLGTFTQITWTSTGQEYWHGITVGTAVPEPATLGLLGLGLLGLVVRQRFTKRT